MTKKRILIAAAAVVALAAIVWIARGGGGVDVSVATARRDTLSVTIPAEGRTRARDQFTVAAPVSGRLTRLDLEAGDLVEQGQLLGRLFPAPEDSRIVATIRAEVDAAQARYQDAETRLLEAELQALQAEREAERRRPLLELGAITREQMEQAELAAVKLQLAKAGDHSVRACLC